MTKTNKANSPLRSILSIGLNVGSTEPANQLSRTIAACSFLGDFDCYRLGQGEWEGVTERKIHVIFSEGQTLDSSFVADLALCLGQDSIGFTSADPSSLIPVIWGLVQKDGTVIAPRENNFIDAILCGESLTDDPTFSVMAFIKQEEELAMA